MAYNTKIAAALVVGLGGAATLGVGSIAGTVAAGNDSRIVGAVQTSTLTANGDLMVRAAGVPAPLAIGSAATVLRSTGSAPEWVTHSTALDDLASTRGYLLRRGASTWAGFAAQTANTLIGGDGTDVTARTTAEVRAMLFPDGAGPFSTTSYLGGSTTTGYVEPRFGPGRSLAFTVYKRANVGGAVHVIVTRIDNYSSTNFGWFVHVWSDGNISLLLQGVGVWNLPTSWDSLSVGRHTYAISAHTTTGSTVELRVSLDGGAVAATSTQTGTYAPPTVAHPLFIGRAATGGFERPLTAGDLLAIMTTSTEVSDADLRILSAAPGIYPAVGTGTVSFHLDIPRDLVPGYNLIHPTVGSWSLPVNGTLSRRMVP